MSTVRIENVGRWYPEQAFDVTAETIERYADATNDANPMYRSASESIAPPLFGIVAGWPAVELCVSDTLPPAMLTKVVHQAQDTHLRRPMRAGETVLSRARVLGVAAGPRAMTLSVEVESRAEGAHVGSFYATVYVREGKQPSAGESPPEIKAEPTGEVIASVEYAIDGDQAVRYAGASGDHNPIHVDDAAAKAIGLPGVILHGMCTLALACRAAVERLAGGDPSKLRRFAGRFSRPVRPGQALTTTFRAAAAGGYAFECTTEAGVVVRDGLATIA